MKTDPTRFPQFISALAALRGFGETDRAEVWHQRLAFSFEDIVALESALPAVDPLVAPPLPQTGFSVMRRPAGVVAQGGATALAGRVRRGQIAAKTIAEQALSAARDWKTANMFVSLRDDDVRAQAAGIDAMVAQGGDPGMLAGVPFAIKDLMPVRGYPMTGGTFARTARVMEHDAPLVARLRRAGAIIFGATNLHELAYGVTSENPHFGAVANPRFAGRVPGGSSGGSAAAVAAGIVPLAIGTDTGGSIRIPAACCGIVGFKPSYGVVDKSEVLPLAWSLDHAGPLAACVDDAALAFEVLAGLPEGAAGGLPERPPAFVMLRGMFDEHVEPGVARCMAALESAWRAAGARVTAAAVDALRLAGAAQLVTLATEAAEAHADLLLGDATGLGDDVRLRLEIGQCFLASDYVKAQRIRREACDALLGALGDADVLVTPTLPCAPPEAGQTMMTVGGRALPVAGMLTRFTSPFNMTGLPALSVPCGFDDQGLPVSVQIVGRRGHDARVLAIGRWIENLVAPDPVHAFVADDE
ncbi:MAG: amidase [Betaproteobacteria bacterium]|nr:amidase [Betaproteobacteria bacterium]